MAFEAGIVKAGLCSSQKPPAFAPTSTEREVGGDANAEMPPRPGQETLFGRSVAPSAFWGSVMEKVAPGPSGLF